MIGFDEFRKRVARVALYALGHSERWPRVFASQVRNSGQELEILRLPVDVSGQRRLQAADGTPCFMWGIDPIGSPNPH